MKKITIKDVAREAGVSIATVSNALNNADVVQPKTREHVLAVAQRLNYVPNLNGKRLRTAQSRTIGLFVASMTGDYYGNMADTMHYICQKHGYELHIFMASDARSIQEKLMNHMVDGAVVFFGTLTAQERQRLRQTDLPVVFVDQEEKGEKVSSVLYESYQAGRMAAEYLLGLGHRDLMHIFGLENNYDSQQRRAGFLDVLKESGVDFRPENMLSGRFERAAAYREMRRYLSEEHPLPEAIFAANDLSAIGCMEALRQFGVRIPEDISIIGCDDILLCGFITPNLTTIRTHMNQLGVEAANEVLRLISQQGGRITRIPGDIIVRQSCSIRAGRDE